MFSNKTETTKWLVVSEQIFSLSEQKRCEIGRADGNDTVSMVDCWWIVVKNDPVYSGHPGLSFKSIMTIKQNFCITWISFNSDLVKNWFLQAKFHCKFHGS